MLRHIELAFWYFLAFMMIWGAGLIQHKNAPRLDINIIATCMVLCASCCMVLGYYQFKMRKY